MDELSFPLTFESQEALLEFVRAHLHVEGREEQGTLSYLPTEVYADVYLCGELVSDECVATYSEEGSF